MPHTNTARNRFSVNDPYIQVSRAEATASAASRARPSVADLGRPAGHEQFWHSAEMRQALGDPAFKVGDDTLVVASEFRLIQE